MEILFLAGRIVFGGYFILNGINHFARFGMMAGYAKSKGVQSSGIAVVVTGLMLLGGGTCIVIGFYPVVGAGLLVAFLIPVSFIMHDFWKVEDPQVRMVEMVSFSKNLALAGAALMMMAHATPWTFSLDGLLQ